MGVEGSLMLTNDFTLPLQNCERHGVEFNPATGEVVCAKNSKRGIRENGEPAAAGTWRRNSMSGQKGESCRH
jgi:hypothetical protein